MAAFGQDMPVERQTVLVRTYCVACHRDAQKNGGLSLEKFDAGHADPGLLAMLVSKMKTGAFGAAGLKGPGREAEAAVIAALSVAARGAEEWQVRESGPVVTAGIVRPAGAEDLYRLTLVCDARTEYGEMQVSWAPNVPAPSQVMTVAVDDGAAERYSLNVVEPYANGMKGESGPGAMKVRARLPQRTMTVRNVLGSETVVFPFAQLGAEVRARLSVCFGR
jgi:hypothetical protein